MPVLVEDGIDRQTEAATVTLLPRVAFKISLLLFCSITVEGEASDKERQFCVQARNLIFCLPVSYTFLIRTVSKFIFSAPKSTRFQRFVFVISALTAETASQVRVKNAEQLTPKC